MTLIEEAKQALKRYKESLISVQKGKTILPSNSVCLDLYVSPINVQMLDLPLFQVLIDKLAHRHSNGKYFRTLSFAQLVTSVDMSDFEKLNPRNVYLSFEEQRIIVFNLNVVQQHIHKMLILNSLYNFDSEEFHILNQRCLKFVSFCVRKLDVEKIAKVTIPSWFDARSNVSIEYTPDGKLNSIDSPMKFNLVTKGDQIYLEAKQSFIFCKNSTFIEREKKLLSNWHPIFSICTIVEISGETFSMPLDTMKDCKVFLVVSPEFFPSLTPKPLSIFHQTSSKLLTITQNISVHNYKMSERNTAKIVKNMNLSQQTFDLCLEKLPDLFRKIQWSLLYKSFTEQALSANICFQHTIRQICVSEVHCIVLLGETLVLSWGLGRDGSLGHGDFQDVQSPKLLKTINHSIDDSTGISKICCASGAYGSHSALLTSSLDVLTFGKYIAIGQGTSDDICMPTRIAHHLFESCNGVYSVKLNIVDVHVGAGFTTFLEESGKVFSCGAYVQGVLGHKSFWIDRHSTTYTTSNSYRERYDKLLLSGGKKKNSSRRMISYMFHPKMISEFKISGVFFRNKVSVKLLACSTNHSICSDTFNRVFGWGCNLFGQVGVGHSENVPVPTQLESYINNDFILKKTQTLLGNATLTSIKCFLNQSLIHFQAKSNERNFLYWGVENDIYIENYSLVLKKYLRQRSNRQSISMRSTNMNIKPVSSEAYKQFMSSQKDYAYTSKGFKYFEYPWAWPRLSSTNNILQGNESWHSGIGINARMLRCFYERNEKKHCQNDFESHFNLRVNARDGIVFANWEVLALRNSTLHMRFVEHNHCTTTNIFLSFPLFSKYTILYVFAVLYSGDIYNIYLSKIIDAQMFLETLRFCHILNYESLKTELENFGNGIFDTFHLKISSLLLLETTSLSRDLIIYIGGSEVGKIHSWIVSIYENSGTSTRHTPVKLHSYLSFEFIVHQLYTGETNIPLFLKLENEDISSILHFFHNYKLNEFENLLSQRIILNEDSYTFWHSFSRGGEYPELFQRCINYAKKQVTLPQDTLYSIPFLTATWYGKHLDITGQGQTLKRLRTQDILSEQRAEENNLWNDLPSRVEIFVFVLYSLTYATVLKLDALLQYTRAINMTMFLLLCILLYKFQISI